MLAPTVAPTVSPVRTPASRPYPTPVINMPTDVLPLTQELLPMGMLVCFFALITLLTSKPDEKETEEFPNFFISIVGRVRVKPTYV
jgi:hypothetical protein